MADVFIIIIIKKIYFFVQDYSKLISTNRSKIFLINDKFFMHVCKIENFFMIFFFLIILKLKNNFVVTEIRDKNNAVAILTINTAFT